MASVLTGSGAARQSRRHTSEQAGALCKRMRRWPTEHQCEARHTSHIEDLIIEDGKHPTTQCRAINCAPSIYHKAGR